MSAHPLINELETPSTCPTTTCCSIPLLVDDAARIAALAEIHPQHTCESLITTLLHHALRNIELPPDTPHANTGDV